MQKTHAHFNIAERDWSRAMITTLSVLLVALLVMSLSLTGQLNEARTRIDNMTQKAFFEICELTEGLSVNFRKLLVAGDMGQIQLLLNDISQQAQGASGDLALLPLGEETISATLKFVNQAGDYSEGLSVRLASGGAITEADYDTISTLSENAAAFSVGMASLLQRYENGEVSLNSNAASGDESLYPLTNPATEYPTLLYDGPFSDGATGGEFKALAGMPTLTQSEAEQQLVAFFGPNAVTNMVFTGENNIPIDCYEFAFTANGYPLTAGVTKQGGEVIYILSDSTVTETNFTAEQLLDTARAFLVARGYGALEMSYYSRFDGILTVNFAAVQNDVVLYPDLIKLQISMRDGAIIGLEAANYLMNHVPRTIELPAITEEEAIMRLNSRLTAKSTRLCVIPVNTNEVLCYEISATDGVDNFLVYIDAKTGAERELMQLVNDENGALVM